MCVHWKANFGEESDSETWLRETSVYFELRNADTRLDIAIIQ